MALVVQRGIHRARSCKMIWFKLMFWLPSGISSKELDCQWRRLKRCGLNPWVRKILLKWEWQPTPVFLPGESYGQAEVNVAIKNGIWPHQSSSKRRWFRSLCRLLCLARLEFTASRSGETLKLSVRNTPVPISSVSLRVQTMNSSCVAETWPQYTDTKLNLRHRGLLKQERIV